MKPIPKIKDFELPKRQISTIYFNGMKLDFIVKEVNVSMKNENHGMTILPTSTYEECSITGIILNIEKNIDQDFDLEDFFRAPEKNPDKFEDCSLPL
jgi:hypothetical protein